MNNLVLYGAIAALIVIAILAWRLLANRRPVPEQLRQGSRLPDFEAYDESGNVVRSGDLTGAPAVMLFVRGNWCPFCNSQVKNLTKYYKDIVDLGARLIFVTPKPLETTRRVAKFYEVDFDFWLDDSLAVARQLGLLLPEGVPKSHVGEYGSDTVWPTSLVIDSEGQIVYVNLSKFIADRPDPKALLGAIQQTL